jgi:hypothetical protein
MYGIRIVLLSLRPPSLAGSLAYTPTLSRPLEKRKARYKRSVEKPWIEGRFSRTLLLRFSVNRVEAKVIPSTL